MLDWSRYSNKSWLNESSIKAARFCRESLSGVPRGHHSG